MRLRGRDPDPSQAGKRRPRIRRKKHDPSARNLIRVSKGPAHPKHMNSQAAPRAAVDGAPPEETAFRRLLPRRTEPHPDANTEPHPNR